MKCTVIVGLAGMLAVATAAGAEPRRFELDLTAGAPAAAPRLAPWRTVTLDPEYAGQWVVLGDLDGDGEVEVVSARNVDNQDVHFTSAVVAQKLDGRVLWRWGNAAIGRSKLHHDVACQIHDWDRDGRAEVVVAGDGFVAEIDGATGAEKRRFPIPAGASDCLVFADLSGQGWPREVIVKNRYTQLWAYSAAGTLLWTVEKPGGARTAHQPVPLDLDGDGRAEVVAGYGVLNPDGSPRWRYSTGRLPPTASHLDCCRPVCGGPSPAAVHLVMTGCGANYMARLDGSGRALWELTGEHFESVDVARLRPDLPGVQFVVDVAHQKGTNLTWVIGDDGTRLGCIRSPYSRFHELVDWNGDGCDEIVFGDTGALVAGAGRVLGVLDLPERSIVQVGDVTGDGVPDVICSSLRDVRLYRNPSTARPPMPPPRGSGLNFTLY